MKQVITSLPFGWDLVPDSRLCGDLHIILYSTATWVSKTFQLNSCCFPWSSSTMPFPYQQQLGYFPWLLKTSLCQSLWGRYKIPEISMINLDNLLEFFLFFRILCYYIDLLKILNQVETYLTLISLYFNFLAKETCCG